MGFLDRLRFQDLGTRLAAVIDTADKAHGARRPATLSLAATRDSWLRHCRATKLIVHGLLLLEGLEAELKVFFRDLQVSDRSGGEPEETTGLGDAGGNP